ncbi:MAG: phosphate ABC transporter substrate-binding/OmpA family protein [Methylococcales bacterium]
MAAKLTPLAKILIAMTIIAVTFAIAWNLGLKDYWGNLGKSDETVTNGSTAVLKNEPKEGKSFFGFESASSGPLGSKTNPLKVSIVSFHGYAPALLANGKSLTTRPGSAFDQLGLNLELVIQDDIPTLSTIFESKAASCAWRTSDFWAQEQPNLRNAGLDAKAIMVVDNTQGADAIITNDSSINSIEDLAGKKIALLQYTPSDGMVIDAIDNSSLSARKKQSIQFVYINVDEGTAGVRAAFNSGQVDAAALWDPDLSLALKATPGSKVVYSTKTATNLIYDVIVCDSRIINDPANEEVLRSLVKGWMAGVNQARQNPDDAVDALVKTEEFFTLLAKEQGAGFIKGLFDNIVWTGLEDNIRILGLAGDTNHYERVYRHFDKIYRKAGALANPNSPVINPQESFDYRFINSMMAENEAAKKEAEKPEFTFSRGERDRAAVKPAALTKPVSVNFATGSFDFSKLSKRIIDTEMVPLIESNGSAYFEVSGNTDSTGSRKLNMRLSRQRAQVVVDYLVREWEFKRDRFVVSGNGPDKPICNEQQPGSEDLNLTQCRARNRTTRVSVLSR